MARDSLGPRGSGVLLEGDDRRRACQLEEELKDVGQA